MATCNVTGTLIDGSAVAVQSATIKFRVLRPVLDAANSLVLPTEVSTTSAANGTWTLAIDQGISGVLSFEYPQNSTATTRRDSYTITVPSSASATFASLLVVET